MSGSEDFEVAASRSPEWITVKRNRTKQPSTEVSEQCTGSSPLYDIIETPTIILNPVPKKTSNKKVRSQWRGLDKYDGKRRLYRSIPSYFPGKIRRRYRRGRLITSFTHYKLLRIAWKLDVSNPEGFDKSDGEFMELDDNDGFEHFVNGWNDNTKDDIAIYIWNRLHETDEIRFP